MKTIEINSTELIGPALDYAVALIEGYECQFDDEVSGPWLVPADGYLNDERPLSDMRYSTDWNQGGPLIFNRHISVIEDSSNMWQARIWSDVRGDFVEVGRRGAYCSTPLIAAMRCLVLFKLGPKVQIPEDLMEGFQK